MNCGEQVNLNAWNSVPGLFGLGAAIVVSALVQCGCVTATDARVSAAAPTEIPEGYGIAIGSILLSASNREIADADERSIVDSFKAKKYEARIRRRVIYEFGFASRVEYLGETTTVSFEVDVDKPFVVRGQVGTYAILDVSQIVTGIFGERNTACVMGGPASFEIRNGAKSYIGRLTVAAHFMSETEARMQQTLERARGVYLIGRPESRLTMSATTIDVKEETLRKLGMDQGGTASGLDTRLMRASERLTWNCEVPPVPPPPGIPRRPGG